MSGSPTESACLGWGLKVNTPFFAACSFLLLRLLRGSLGVTYVKVLSWLLEIVVYNESFVLMWSILLHSLEWILSNCVKQLAFYMWRLSTQRKNVLEWFLRCDFHDQRLSCLP